MSKPSVRDALVASVTCAAPPDSLYASQESIVPNITSPAATREASAGSLRISHSAFVPLKYGSSRRPYVAQYLARGPYRAAQSQIPALRRHCHTMRGATAARPVPKQTGLELVSHADGRRRVAFAGI